jgi:hypothetical protein
VLRATLLGACAPRRVARPRFWGAATQNPTVRAPCVGIVVGLVIYQRPLMVHIVSLHCQVAAITLACDRSNARTLVRA